MTSLQVFSNAPQWFMEQCFELKNLRERPDYHPEPSCWDHINEVAYRAHLIGNVNLILTAWLHDSFKLILNKTNPKTGWPSAPGHDKAAARLVRTNRDIQCWIIYCGGDIECVAWLCEQHMRIGQIDKMRPAKQESLRNHKWFPLLEIFHRCDDMTTEFIL